MRRKKKLAIAAIVVIIGVIALALALSVAALAQPYMPSGTNEDETANGNATPPMPPGMNVTPFTAPASSPTPAPIPGFEAVTLIAAMITIAVFVFRKRRFGGDEKWK